MTDGERERRLDELRHWLEELCEELAAETVHLWAEMREECADKWSEAAGKVWLRICQFEPEELTRLLRSKHELEKYLRRAVSNAWWDARRERARGRSRREKLERAAADPGIGLGTDRLTDSPDLAIRREELRNTHLEPCLQRLSERDRRMLLAKDEDGDSHQEIANREAISEEAVRAAVSRARRAVRKCLIERGVKFAEIP